MKVIVVGGVAGGASAAARLRRLDEKAEIIMFEKGPFVSFSNCGLPYHIAGHIEKEENLILMTPEKFAGQYNIEARVNNEVIGVEADKNEVTIRNNITEETYTESYDKLIVSPGAKAIVPNFEGLELVDHFNLKTVPDVSNIIKTIKAKKAKTAVVIGGGFIGVEAAENLVEAGIKTTLVEGTKQLIQPLDEEMAGYLHLELISKGCDLYLDKFVDKFEKDTVILKDGTRIAADIVIMAIGVSPDTKFLKDSKIETNENGYIKVNEKYQTNYQNVYAAGDAILVDHQLTGEQAPLALAGPANKQGRLIADAIMGKEVINKGYIGTNVIKVFDLNAASTGLNEKMAKELEINYDVAYAAPMDRVGIMPGAVPIMIKLLFNKDTAEVLGAQAISKGAADKRIDVIATGIKFKMTLTDLEDLELSYAPPFGTGKDVVNKIGYTANNLFKGDYKQVTFMDVQNLVSNNAQIIDVREKNEFAAGAIKNAKNIPMSEFRNRLAEFDKTKPVYVHCKTGQRSYNVALALQSHGFDAYNIAGSYDFIVNYENSQKLLDANRQNILV